MEELIGDLRGRDFLDYGCGAGLFIVHAAKSGARKIIGVDAEGTILETARYFTEKEGVPNRCELILSEHFPAFDPEMKFDVILMKDVIEHVEDDEGLLKSAAGALAPGGVLIISTQNALSLNYLAEGIYHRVLQGDKGWFGWDETHLRFYTVFSLQEKLRKAGLSPLAWRANYLIPHKFPRRSSSGKKFYRFEALSEIDRFLGRYAPWNRLGWNIIAKVSS
ncbi:MAG: class I SAM-dependent methyltransferase [Syntrophales bacterium]|nr:class I SAM-dependent methyltransferase [Syntrophales bacterium]